jgi:hypothetical protein
MAKRKPKLMCEICADEMDVIRTIPAAALLPELQTFRCNGCECFATLDPDEIAARMAQAKTARKARTIEPAPVTLEAAE